MTTVGAFLAPVVAGYVAVAEGWRWIWWWTTILFGVTLVAFLFLYEDSKYDPVFTGAAPPTEARLNSISAEDGTISDNKMAQLGITTTTTPVSSTITSHARLTSRGCGSSQRAAGTATGSSSFGTCINHS